MNQQKNVLFNLFTSNEKNSMEVTQVPYETVQHMQTMMNIQSDLGELPTNFNNGEPFEFPSDQSFVIRPADMRRIEEFYEHYAKREIEEKEAKKFTEWDKNFFSNIDKDDVLNLLSVSDYLSLPDLLDIGCSFVASIIQGKSVPELREFFHIENDLSPEEEKKIIEEFKWCEEINKE